MTKDERFTLAIRYAAGMLLLAIFGLVGAMDYADEIAERQLYCDMVAAGHWPDYREIADDECEHGKVSQ